MSDSSLAGCELLAPEQQVTPRPRARSARHCRLCDDELAGDVVNARGDIGRVHRACFIRWDREQEALEMSVTMSLALPDPLEDWAQEGEVPAASVAA